MKLDQYQVDAFATQAFEGNPAAVCPLGEWLSDDVLQAIAEENNLSETAFFVANGDHYELRWFTPLAEVDLCGHATLAAAHVLFHHLGYARAEITFATRSGDLIVSKRGALIEMNFPGSVPVACDAPSNLLAGLGVDSVAVLAAEDYLVVLENESDVLKVTPDFSLLSTIGLRGVIVTAPGTEFDFVSRCFAPKFGVNEDPVTGSAHCQLAPYWQSRLGKSVLRARQLSKRGGTVGCEVRDDRVVLSGTAVTFMAGSIEF